MNRRLARAFSLLTALLLVAALGACDNKKGIKAIQPNFGNIAGNDDVTIVGTGFKPGLEVRFGGRRAKGIVIESNTKIRLKTPSGAEGKVDVTIIDEAGKTVVLKQAFTYRKAGSK